MYAFVVGIKSMHSPPTYSEGIASNLVWDIVNSVEFDPTAKTFYILSGLADTVAQT